MNKVVTSIELSNLNGVTSMDLSLLRTIELILVTQKKSTIVNRALPYLHGGSIEITLTAPLRTKLVRTILEMKQCSSNHTLKFLKFEFEENHQNSQLFPEERFRPFVSSFLWHG